MRGECIQNTGKALVYKRKMPTPIRNKLLRTYAKNKSTIGKDYRFKNIKKNGYNPYINKGLTGANIRNYFLGG